MAMSSKPWHDRVAPARCAVRHAVAVTSAQPYTTVLFDLDHTLLDSAASEASAFESALRGIGIDEPHVYFVEYDRINRALWAAVERDEILPARVRTLRFEQLLAAIGLDADAVTLADAFAAGLGLHGELYPGALEMLEALAEHATLALVTNGLSDVQRTRIDRLGIGQYFDAVIISAEVGASKPSTAIFDIAFEALGTPTKSTALMVGDSLTSDIQGGVNYGIGTCWYNPLCREPDAGSRFDHEIDSLRHLIDVVCTRRDADAPTAQAHADSHHRDE